MCAGRQTPAGKMCVYGRSYTRKEERTDGAGRLVSPRKVYHVSNEVDVSMNHFFIMMLYSARFRDHGKQPSSYVTCAFAPASDTFRHPSRHTANDNVRGPRPASRQGTLVGGSPGLNPPSRLVPIKPIAHHGISWYNASHLQPRGPGLVLPGPQVRFRSPAPGEIPRCHPENARPTCFSIHCPRYERAES